MSETFLDGRVTLYVGDVLAQLALMADDSVDCVVTSPPYWGLRDYGTATWEGGDPECDHELIAGKQLCARCGARREDLQIGLEPTLGEHLEVMVGVFAEIRRVLKPSGTLWINYGDCYATSPNGRSAADTKAAGTDDRTFRDKPFSTVGPIYDPDGGKTGGGQRGANKGNAQGVPQGRVCAGGNLKPKDLCMVPNRLAIALQEAGWWVRSEIIWAKSNPMPESIKDRPATAHEKIFMLTKSERYFYDAEAVRQGRTGDEDANGFRGGCYVAGTAGNRVAVGNKWVSGWASGPGAHSTILHNKPKPVGGRSSYGRHTLGEAVPEAQRRSRGKTPRHSTENNQTQLDGAPRGNGRSLRNWEPAPLDAWSIATRPFPDAHFATFPPELAERCIKAGCPEGGLVLDPFGGAGTTALVALRLDRRAALIELKPDYADMARRRIEADYMGRDEGLRHRMRNRQLDAVGLPLFGGAP